MTFGWGLTHFPRIYSGVAEFDGLLSWIVTHRGLRPALLVDSVMIDMNNCGISSYLFHKRH